jgi:hypothetical protein
MARTYFILPGAAALVVVLLLVTGAALAGDKQPPEVAKSLEGTIVLLQQDTRQFVVRQSDGKEAIIALDDGTDVKTQGKTARWTDLTEGTVVHVMFVPKGGQYLALSVHGLRQVSVLRPARPATEDQKPGVEPITVKGKILKVESDLKEMTIQTFDEKEITFQIDDELRYRLKNSKTSVPDLSKGNAVAAVYVIEAGKNKLVVLRDVVQTKEPPPSQVTPPNPMGRVTPGGTSTQVTQAAAIAGQLPVVPMALPAGFVASTQTPLGAIQGFVVQIRGDMAIVSNFPGLGAGTPDAPVKEATRPPAGQPVGSTPAKDSPPPRQPENAQPRAGQPDPRNPPAEVQRTAREFFVLLGMNSKEPFLIDQQTRVASNNQNLRLSDLREGSEIQATFEVLPDGTRRVILITVLRGAGAGANPVPGQPGQDPPLQGQPGARAGGNVPANAGNVLSGKIARLKGDVIFLQGGQGELAVLMAFNSLEPLRMDEATRFRINDREARFSDLQVGMKVNVFVELVNNVRRVIGIAATQAVKP